MYLSITTDEIEANKINCDIFFSSVICFRCPGGARRESGRTGRKMSSSGLHQTWPLASKNLRGELRLQNIQA